MKLAGTILLAALTVSTAHASGYVGVYALIEKVVFEPDADHPQRVQVFGAFSIAQPGSPGTFQPAQRGYLYFKVPAGANPAPMLKEWNDFKAVAGSGQAVSFWIFGFDASRYNTMPKVRKASEKPADPDDYQLGQGVSPIRRDTDYGPIKALFDAPR